MSCLSLRIVFGMFSPPFSVGRAAAFRLEAERCLANRFQMRLGQRRKILSCGPARPAWAVWFCISRCGMYKLHCGTYKPRCGMKKPQCGTEFPACIRRLPFRTSPFLVRCGAGKDTEPALQKGKQDCQSWGETCQYMVPYCQICLCGTLLAVCLASFRGRGKQKYKQFKYKDYEH